MKQLKKTEYTSPYSGEVTEKKQWVDMVFDDDEGYLFWNQKNHVKTFLDIPLPREFSWSEKGRINEIKHYILRDNQMLVYRSGSVLKPLQCKELSKIFEMSDRQTKALIKKMKDHSVIKELEVDGLIYYIFSPIYGLKAKRITLSIFIVFQVELIKVLPGWVVKKFLDQVKELKPNIKIVE